MAARMSRRIAVEQKRYAVGIRTPRVDIFKRAELAYTRIENAHKVRKKTFVFIYVAVICTTSGGAKHIRVCVTHYDQSAQNRGQKVFTRGTLRLCREA